MHFSTISFSTNGRARTATRTDEHPSSRAGESCCEGDSGTVMILAHLLLQLRHSSKQASFLLAFCFHRPLHSQILQENEQHSITITPSISNLQHSARNYKPRRIALVTPLYNLLTPNASPTRLSSWITGNAPPSEKKKLLKNSMN